MNLKRVVGAISTWSAVSIGVTAAVYAAYAGVTWLQYGRKKPKTGKDADALLDMFMPEFEIGGYHKIHVAAPAQVALAAATELDLESSAVIRGIFKGRELLLRSQPDSTIRPRGLLAQTKSMGWGLLAELPGREIVMGAVTKPWEANPEFRALPPDEFAAFQEPGYVKIIWTLRADSAVNGESVFRTETRAVATDPEARRKFRWYWSFLSPGIIAIRGVMLPTVKAEAERRSRGRGRLDWGPAMPFFQRVTASFRRVTASKAERSRPLPGDDCISRPIGSLTHAITVGCSRRDLWPWLVQMGAGRAGWYSYDFLDNGCGRSAGRILPEYQKLSVGMLFPALPGATDGFFLLAYEPERFLVLGANPRNGEYAATWSLVLEDAGVEQTRLITRARANEGYGFHGLPLGLVKGIHYIMQRKQLIEVARRAEAASGTASEWSVAS